MFEVYSKMLGRNFSLYENNRTLSFLGRVKNDAEWNTIPRKPSLNSKLIYLMIVPITVGSGFGNNTYATLANIDLSSNREQIRFTWFEMTSSEDPFYKAGPIPSPNSGQITIDVYEIDGSESGTYGLVLQNSTDYLSITDASRLGCCVWVYSGNIQSGFSIPSNIPGYESCIIFTNWNDNGCVLSLDEEKRVRIYSSEFTWNPTVERTNYDLNIKIVAFSSGFTIPLTGFEAGLLIWNENGVLTFSSDYPPVKVAKFVDYSGTGSFLNRVIDLGGEGYMVPITKSIGGLYRSYIQRERFAAVGLSMSGRNVTIRKSVELMDYNGHNTFSNPSILVPNYPFPILQASDYFG